MLSLSQIKIPCGGDERAVERKIRNLLHLRREDRIEKLTILRKSLDCRKKPLLFEVCTAAFCLAPGREKALLKKAVPGLSEYTRAVYRFPEPGTETLIHRPVIVGAGPAGLFAALELSRHGYAPVVIERGRPMAERIRDVERFFAGGSLDPVSNVQFGEGGAGTFSDGKLNTLVRDRSGRMEEVFTSFVRCGAPDEILYDARPHIGTDLLRVTVVRMREEIIAAGGSFLFETKMNSLVLTGVGSDRRITGIRCTSSSPEIYRFARPEEDGSAVIPADAVILAPGHSARDTFTALHEQQVPLRQKNFAVGMRVVHPQGLIDFSQYGTDSPEEMERMHLAPASYKLTARASDSRGVYTFCMCPGGYVVNASSEPGALAVNGMSNYARESGYANSAVIMTVDKEDFGSEHPLAGMEFQRKLEKKAYLLCGGKVPYESFGEYEEGRLSDEYIRNPAEFIKGPAEHAPVHELLPGPLRTAFIEGMREFDRRIAGFAGENCVVAGLESRTSSPVRIDRGDDFQSPVRGLYPCGEGAGYAGGITSAAMDGIRSAEAVGKRFAPYDAASAKAALRKTARKRRDGLSAGYRRTASEGIASRIRELNEYREAERLFIYMSFGSEAETGRIIEAAYEDGKEVFVPRIIPGENREMVFARILPDTVFVPDSHGIPEPEPGGTEYLPGSAGGAAAEDDSSGSPPDGREEPKTLVIVPGLAFDRQGRRLGYGGGYYDRAISAMRQNSRSFIFAGTAFAALPMDPLPADTHDEAADLVITENETIRILYNVT